MIRVYLDWNIFANLKRYKESKEPYKSLNAYLLKNQDKILIPYSSAHLTDLLVSFNHSEHGKVETERDLSYLAELSQDLCLVHDITDNKTYPKKYKVREYFDEIYRDKGLEFDTFEQFYTAFDYPGFDELRKQIVHALDQIPNPIDQKYIDQTPQDFQIMKDAFSGKSMLDGVKGLVNLINQYNSEPRVYRGMRNSSLAQLKLDLDYTKEADPIRKISENLASSPLNMTFNEFCEGLLSIYYKGTVPGRFSTFTMYYLMLDFFGYYRDKKFKNLVLDAFHTYYGAHCDFFISDDDNTYRKAKALYKYLNIETTVCKSDEFKANLQSRSASDGVIHDPIVEVVTQVIKSNPLAANLQDGDRNPVDVYKPSYYILNHFNRVQVTHNSNEKYCIYTYKNPFNYSDVLFFKEVEYVVNLLVNELGTDEQNRSVYLSNTEDSEILENYWPGRSWQCEDWKIKLGIRESPYQLILSFEFLN